MLLLLNIWFSHLWTNYDHFTCGLGAGDGAGGGDSISEKSEMSFRIEREEVVME